MSFTIIFLLGGALSLIINNLLLFGAGRRYERDKWKGLTKSLAKKSSSSCLFIRKRAIGLD